MVMTKGVLEDFNINNNNECFTTLNIKVVYLYKKNCIYVWKQSNNE